MNKNRLLLLEEVSYKKLNGRMLWWVIYAGLKNKRSFLQIYYWLAPVTLMELPTLKLPLLMVNKRPKYVMPSMN